MSEVIIQQLSPEDYPLKGSKMISYIVYEDSEGLTALCAGFDDESSYEPHLHLLEMAEEEGLVPESAKVLGGGILTGDSLKKQRDSHALGGVENSVLTSYKEFLYHLYKAKHQFLDLRLSS